MPLGASTAAVSGALKKRSKTDIFWEKPKPGYMAELAFNVFDKNHDGFVTKSEMLKISNKLNMNLTKEKVKKET